LGWFIPPIGLSLVLEVEQMMWGEWDRFAMGWIPPKDGQIISDWWFGTCILFFHILGIIIPTDSNIVQRGGSIYMPGFNRMWCFYLLGGCHTYIYNIHIYLGLYRLGWFQIWQLSFDWSRGSFLFLSIKLFCSVCG
jgi:hypothetical protein